MEDQNQVTDDKPIADGSKPGFLRKKAGLIAGWLVIGGVAYSLLSFVAFATSVENNCRHEQFNPRKNEAVTKKELTGLEKSVIGFLKSEAGQSLGMGVLKAAEAPWKSMGFVTSGRYNAVRDKAFEIAGIDENNPKHDTKRFMFYRQLEVAVSDTNKFSDYVYIPFEKLKNYVEKNSSYKLEGWDEWKEVIEENSYKEKVVSLGKAFYKADSKAQNGNEDGVVGIIEYKRMINQMGYRTQEDIINGLAKRLEGKKAESLKAEISDMISKAEKNPAYIHSNVPNTIPLQKLKEYLTK